MTDFIAGAFVDVKPEAKGFRSELKRKVDDAIKGSAAFKIPVEIDPKRFKSTIRDLSKGVAPVKVPIEPGTSVTALKRSFKKIVDDASRDLKVKIPVEVQTKGKTQAPTGAASRTATAAKNEAIRVPIVISTTVAELKTAIKAKIDSAKKGQKIDIPIEAKGAATGKPVTRAVVQENVAPKAAAATSAAATAAAVSVPIKISTTVEELKKAIKSKLDSAQKDQKIVVPIEVKQVGKVAPTGGTQRTPASGKASGAADAADQVDKSNEKAEKSTKKLTEAQKRQAVVAATVQKSTNDLAIAERLFAQASDSTITTEERSQRLREARAAATKAAKGSNDLLATSEANLTLKQKSALETRVSLAQSLRSDVTATQEKVAANKAATAVESKSADARKKSAEVIAFEAKEIQDLNSLHLKENEVLAAEAALRRQTNAARKLGLTSIAQENEAQLKLIATQKEAIVLQRQELKGDTARARSQKTAGRGAASAVLSLLGIRGATLASSAAFLAGAASAAIFTKAIGVFASFEQELNVFQATTGATASQMERVSKAAHDLGADITLPAVSAADAAQAMSQLARAGLSVEDSIQGARGVLELASAAMISNADAAELTASALNAFGLEGSDAVHVADLLANAANNAQGSISEMGAAMQQASAIAHQVGFSLDNTIATLTIFARHGLRGSDAGTSLRTALSRLIAPTHKAAEIIGELGLNIRNANGNIRPDIFVQFGQATKDLSPALRDMIAETIAGQDAIRAFAIGASEGARGLKLAQLQMAATGTAAEIAAARSKGLAGTFSALQSNTETLGTSLGKLASGPVKVVTTELNALLVSLNQLATGDFGSFAEGIEKDFEQAGANIKQRAAGLKDIFNPSSNFQDVKHGLSELFSNAPAVDKETQHINDLRDALQKLQGLRVQAFTIGADITPITAKIQDIRRQLKAAKEDAGLLIPVTPLEKALAKLRTAQKTAQDIRSEALATGAGPNDKFIKDLDALLHNIDVRIKITTKTFKQNAKQMGKDLEEIKAPDLAKAFQKEFGLIAQQPLLATPEVLSSIGDMARKIKSTGAPLTGAAGKEMGSKLIETLTTIIAQAVEDDNSDLAQDVRALGLKIAPLFGAGIAEGFKNIKIPLTDQQLEDALLPARIKTARAEAFGTVSDQIAAKQGELDRLNKQLGQVVKGSAQEETILGKITAAKDAIRSLREGQASDQKKKDDASDKRITDVLAGRERTLTQALEKAQATETLKDDLRRERDLKVFYAEQIKTIKATVKDTDNRNQQVSAAEDNLFKITQQFEEDRAGRREQLRNLALKPIDAGVERAAETESLKDDVKQANRKVRFWQTQVRNLKELVKQRKATGAELQSAQDALDDSEKDAREARKGRRQQVTDDREQGLQLDIEFASTIENKGKELRARTAFIAFLEQQKKHFKGNVNKLKELRNQIAEQRKAIKELKGETDESKGTTVFELLQQNAETFKANAGNLISGQQPFAGPAGFTADIAQFLIRQKKATAEAKAAAKGSASTGDPFDLKSAFVGPAGLSTFATESAKKVTTIADAARSAFVGPNGVSTFATQAAKDLKTVGDAALVTASKIKQIAETPGNKTLFTTGQPEGLVKAGNINLLNRPNVKNPKGGFSSVLSETVGIGDKKHPGLTAVIPTVLGNTKSTKGEKPRIVSPDEALKHFKETGENLGIFASLAAAEKYSDLLHQQQARLGSQRRNLTGLDPTAPAPATSPDAVKRTDFSALTGAVVRLTNVLERQPGTGKTSTTSARREPDKSGRGHYAVASASRRVVEERIGGL